MVPFIILILVLVLVVFPLWASIKILGLGNKNEELEGKIQALEVRLRTLGESRSPVAPTASLQVPVPPAALVPAVELPPVITAPAPPIPEARPAADPPVIPSPPITTAPADEPPVVAPPPVYDPKPSPRINWEQFMGAKLFAWLGGLAAFLSAAFFVKYSFEHDLIPAEVRVALGFLFALGLIIGGLKIDRERHAPLVHSLCGAGIVTLYAVTFACNSIYHFAFFGPLATFLLMSLITATAFLLAVRLDARAIAVLGMLGGFLTPALLSTGQDNPPGLFGYVALLDVGLLAVALHRRWFFLVGLGATGTVIMQISWAEKFFVAAKAPTAVIICLAFCALFFVAYVSARRLQRNSPVLLWSAIAFPLVAFGFAGAFLGYPGISARPGLLFTFVLLADAVLLAIAGVDDEMPRLHLVAGAIVFILLAAWTGVHLTEELLPWALGFYLLFAALHTGFPLVLERHRPATAPTWWSQAFPPLALLLMFLPLVKLEAVSLLFWPCVLLVDVLAIGLAVITASLAAVAAVLVLTLIATGLWLFHIPVTIHAEPSLLLIVGGFAVLFFAAGIILARKLGDRLAPLPASAIFSDARSQIPALSALLPFLLLIMMTQRLPLPNPSPILGLAGLLVVLTLGLTVILSGAFDQPASSATEESPAETNTPPRGVEWLPACALAGTFALEFAWQSRHRTVDEPTVVLAWFLVFYAIFSLFPFAFRRRFVATTGPWAVAALGGVAHFPLVYRLVQRNWPNDFLGLIPALFAVAPLLSLIAVLRRSSANAGARADASRLNQLAWYGGVALLFITLIFPIQFERQWITLGWALEGAALLWLFHRVPHSGLRLAGATLLIAAFVRLALNPSVFRYHPTGAAVLNWYFYSYGVTIACLFVGARLLHPPRDQVVGINAPPLLNALGTILAFLLLNIEIADFFAPIGSRALTFQFSGNFARDMTYTIAWALFALGLLLLSIWQRTRLGRYAALVLLGVVLLKLFVHDLARLEALYRVGALFGVAVIATMASFAYQRFLPGNEKPASENP